MSGVPRHDLRDGERVVKESLLGRIALAAFVAGCGEAVEFPEAPSSPRALHVAARPEAEVSCRVAARSWSGEVTLHRDGPVFGALVVEDADVEVELPRTGTVGARVLLRTRDIELATWVRSVELFLARPRAIGGVVFPAANMPLAWSGRGRSGSVEVAVDVKDVLAEGRVVDELACADVSPMQRAFDRPPPWADQPFELAPLEAVGLGADVAISADAEGSPVATLLAGAPGSLEAGVRNGGARLVVLDHGDYVVSGWVPDHTLVEELAARRLHPGSLLPRPIGVAGSLYIDHTPSCRHDVALFGERDGAIVEIGVLRGGARFAGDSDAPERSDGMLAIVVVGPQLLSLAEGARILVRERDVAYDSCRGTAGPVL
jgi:hypothetical protein